MRFADFAVDLAAVVRATRSVAAHHAALRARQLDALRQSPSFSGAPRKAAAPTEVEEEGPAGGRDVAAEETGAVVHTTHGSTANRPAGAESGTLGRSAGGGGGGGVFSQLQHQTGASFPVSTGAEIHSPLHPATSAGKPHSPLSVPSSRTADGPSTSAELDDVPPGVDINVFRTGSKMLGSMGKKKVPLPEKTQYPAPWAGLTSSANPRFEATADARPEPHPKLPEAAPTMSSAQTEDEAKIPSPTPATPVEEALPNPLQAISRDFELRESKVPATRLSRLWNYGGLAAGMLGGAVTESLTRAVGGGGGAGGAQGSVMLSSANMDRLVTRLSRMRGAALKMGQMMSFQDAKMLPGPIHEVLQRVQDRADYMPSYQRDRVLSANLGPEWRALFSEFEEKPLAAASIGQVHRARLSSSGKAVAVKIQFPGVADSINSDLDNLGVLLTATKLLPKGLYLDKTIANARTELGWECDYEREARCLSRFGSLMADERDVFRVPSVHAEASGRQVLTMDFMEGTAVTRVASFTQAQRDWLGTQILRLCLREITEFRFMQTDPNWTNFLYNEATGRIELLDFGASREFPQEFVEQYVRLLEAASRSDGGAVKALSEELGYLTGLESRAMLDAHLGSVLTLAEPFSGSAPEVYDFSDQTITERVKGFIPTMLKERLAPPPEETYSLHRKLSGAFLLCARLRSRVPCRELFRESLEKGGFTDKA